MTQNLTNASQKYVTLEVWNTWYSNRNWTCVFLLVVKACICSQIAQGDCGLAAGFSMCCYQRKRLAEGGQTIDFQVLGCVENTSVQDVPLDTKEQLTRDFLIPSFPKVQDPIKPGLDGNDRH